MAINPNFIIASSQGDLRDEILQVSLFWICAMLLFLYLNKNKKIYLYLLAFIAGLALWGKLMFLGYLVGVTISFLIFWKKGLAFLKTKIFKDKYAGMIFVFFILLGLSPLIYFNITSKGKTTFYLLNSLLASPNGWNNLNFLNNKNERFRHLHALLTNSPVIFNFPRINFIFPSLFYTSLLFILCCFLFFNRQILYKNKILFLLSTYLTLFLLTCLLPSGNPHPEHLFIIFPFPQLVIALSLFSIFSFINKRKQIISLFIFLIPLLYLYWECALIVKYTTEVIKANPLNTQLEINDYLLEQNISEVICLGGGALQVVDFLSKGKIITYGFHSDTDDTTYVALPYENQITLPPTLDSVYEKHLKSSNKFYVLTVKNNKQFTRLEELAKQDNKSLQLTREFKDNNGEWENKLYLAQDRR